MEVSSGADGIGEDVGGQAGGMATDTMRGKQCWRREGAPLPAQIASSRPPRSGEEGIDSAAGRGSLVLARRAWSQKPRPWR